MLIMHITAVRLLMCVLGVPKTAFYRLRYNKGSPILYLRLNFDNSLINGYQNQNYFATLLWPRILAIHMKSIVSLSQSDLMLL